MSESLSALICRLGLGDLSLLLMLCGATVHLPNFDTRWIKWWCQIEIGGEEGVVLDDTANIISCGVRLRVSIA